MTSQQKKIHIPEDYLKSHVVGDFTLEEVTDRINQAIEIACRPILTYVVKVLRILGATPDLISQFESLTYEKSAAIRAVTDEMSIIFTLENVNKDYQFKFDVPNDPALVRRVLEFAGGTLMCGITFWKFLCETRPELLIALRELNSDIIWDKLNIDAYKKVLYFTKKSDESDFPCKVGLLVKWADKHGRILIVKDSKKKFTKK